MSVNPRAPTSFVAHIPARLLQDTGLSPRARLLWAILATFADGHTRRTYVGTRKLEHLLECGRVSRQQAERQLIRAGWLAVEQERGAPGRFGRRWFTLLKCTAVQKPDTGKKS